MVYSLQNYFLLNFINLKHLGTRFFGVFEKLRHWGTRFKRKIKIKALGQWRSWNEGARAPQRLNGLGKTLVICSVAEHNHNAPIYRSQVSLIVECSMLYVVLQNIITMLLYIGAKSV